MRPRQLEFNILDQDEILKSSVVCVRNDRIYEAGFIVPTLEGVNDPRMGTCERDRICMTCKGSNIDCPGHFGHIELAKPMYHSGYLEHIRTLLRLVCFNCSKLLYPRDKDHVENINRIRNQKQRFNQIKNICERYSLRVCDMQTEGCGMR
jgi:DNA-directed RNA polymerase II subunit RPB1